MIILARSLKKEIIKTFEKICEQIRYDLSDDVDYRSSIRSEEQLDKEVINRATEELERNFDAWNNWIFEDDFENDIKYEKAKKEIINLIKLELFYETKYKHN